MSDLNDLLRRRRVFHFGAEHLQSLFDLPKDVYVAGVRADPEHRSIVLDLVSERFSPVVEGGVVPQVAAEVYVKPVYESDPGSSRPYRYLRASIEPRTEDGDG